MPEQVQCPSCKQKLRVPDNLLGKKVKCPKCATIFDAKVDESKEEGEGGRYGFTPEPEPKPRSKALRRAAGEEIEDEDDDEEPVRTRRSSSDQDEEDEEEDQDDEEPRPKKKKNAKRIRRNRALEKVSAPATCLIVLGSIGIFCAIVSAIATAFSLQQRFMPKGAPERSQAEMVGNLIGIFVAFIIYLLILLGATKMKRLESYGISMLISILCLFPCTCCFVAIPFGIWSLVVINSSDVKPYFK